MFDGDSETPHPGITGVARRLLGSLVAFLTTKFELLNTEIQEEKRRILELLVLAASAMLVSAMALMVLTFSIIACFWDTPNRMTALLIICAVYVAIATFLFIRLHRKTSLRTKVFETTVEELRNDSEWIKHHL
jgi:uncharacterized membrane protein YqjE